MTFCLELSLQIKIMAQKIIPPKELSRLNIIGVKIIDHKRAYKNSQGGIKSKQIRRTKYLKICWMCGSPYESFKYNTYACSPRCVHNIIYARKRGFNPPARMESLVKEKNVKDIKENFGYH